MKSKSFTFLAVLLAVMLTFCFTSVSSQVKKEIYEWRIYSLTQDDGTIDAFFEKALIPAYNRQGITAGAFKLLETEDIELRYLLLVYPDIETYMKVKKDIWKDSKFRTEAQPYFDKTAPNPVYSNFESYLAEAFDKVPKIQTPDKGRTLFELRIYRSPNEEANQRKVDMFNVDELAIFDKTGINPVCYGEVLSGPRMPSLIYLTWYKDKETRDKVWNSFVNHPDWKHISKLEKYKHTATDNKSRLLSPMPYSQY
jgi:hypothetical protein